MAMTIRRSRRTATGLAAFAASALTCIAAGHAADPDKAVDKIPTVSPIKHVIIIVGENRSFDHLFATYVPKNRHERVLNLLSQGIIKADGSPGPNFAKGHQFKITAPPNGSGNFFISAGASSKFLYQTLPPPDLGGVQNPPVAFILTIPGGDPGLPPQDQFLFGTGGTGLPNTVGPDIRITNVNALPPGPFQMTGPTMPYDAYTADTIHQFFQMYQQMDCAIDREHVSRGNPTGCLHDLQSAITTTYATSPLTTPPQVPHDTGQVMAVFNMQRGDVPLFKSLADQFTMSDNYHQPVMGGTGPELGPARLRRPGVLHRRLRRRQRRDPAGLADLQPKPGGRGLQQRQLQSLHIARPVVQLLRRKRARRQADPRLFGEAPL